MEAKIRQRLKRWLCKLIGCEVQAPKAAPVVCKSGDLETFHHDGYDVEVHLFPDEQTIRMQVYLKGSCVLVGDCRRGEVVEWTHGTHHPSYKTRKYMQEYATNRLIQMKDSK